MSAYDPVIITPRLLPGVRIGDAFVSVEPTGGADRQGKPAWRWYVDAPGFEASESDLHGWGDAGEMLGTLLAFLEACAESRSYGARTGRKGENADLFSEHVGAWAEENSDEISMRRFEIEEPEESERVSEGGAR